MSVMIVLCSLEYAKYGTPANIKNYFFQKFSRRFSLHSFSLGLSYYYY